MSYFPSSSTVDLEAHYLKHYLEATAEVEKAQVVAGFLREASPDEWPIANWVFEALRKWKAAAFPVEEAFPLRSFNREPPDYDVDECLRIVAQAIAKPWNKRTLAAHGRNYERRVRQIESEAAFDMQLFERCKSAISDLRRDYAAFVRQGKIPRRIDKPSSLKEREQMQKRARLMDLVFLKGSAPKDLGIPSYKGGVWLVDVFHMGPPESGGPRFHSGVDMLEQFLSGRLDYAAAKLVAWIIGMDQKRVRAHAVRPPRK